MTSKLVTSRYHGLLLIVQISSPKKLCLHNSFLILEQTYWYVNLKEMVNWLSICHLHFKRLICSKFSKYAIPLCNLIYIIALSFVQYLFLESILRNHWPFWRKKYIINILQQRTSPRETELNHCGVRQSKTLDFLL